MPFFATYSHDYSQDGIKTSAEGKGSIEGAGAALGSTGELDL